MQELILTHQIQINKLKSESNLTLEDLKSNNMKTNFNIDYSINELIEEIEENGEIGEIGEDYNNDNLNKLLVVDPNNIYATKTLKAL